MDDDDDLFSNASQDICMIGLDIGYNKQTERDLRQNNICSLVYDFMVWKTIILV